MSKRMLLLSAVLLLLLVPAGFLLFNNQQDTLLALPPATELSLAEKAGQLFVVGHWSKTLTSETTKLIEDLHLGGVIIMDAGGDGGKVKGWSRAWREVNTTLPLLIGIDQEGGLVSRLKGAPYTQIAQPEITDTETAYRIASQRAEELTVLGINTNFSPVLDESTNPDAFMYDRVFRTPELIASLGDAMIRGYQNNGITAVPKHYPGHPDTTDDSHLIAPVLNLTATEYETHTRAFSDVIQAGNTHLLMTAHVLIPSLDTEYPATVSATILSDLRNRIGYQGVIITDDLAMQAISDQWSYGEAAVLSLKAGADMIMLAAEPEVASSTITAVITAVENGNLSEARIDDAYDRVRALKEQFR